MSTSPTMRLADLHLPGIQPVRAADDVAIADLRLDHREIDRAVPTAFVALNGTQRHGLAYAQAAVDAGAVAVLYDPEGAGAQPLPEAVPVLAIPQLRQRLGVLALRLFGEPQRQLCVIGVTGTNGKTSTVQLIAQALTIAGIRCATLGTLGAGIWPELAAGERTTPDAIGIARAFAGFVAAGARCVAMEVSSHALEQERVAALPFRIAVFTNLTRDHLDYHGTMAAYGAAKRKLFQWEGLKAIVSNRDDAFGAELLATAPAPRVVGYGLEGAGSGARGALDLYASGLELHAEGLRFTLLGNDGWRACRTRLLGQFNVSNLLAVAGTLRALGLPLEQVAVLLAQLSPVPGRMQRVSASAAEPLVVVDYAHTPDALAQALRSVRAHTRGQLHCVFGCGGDRDRGKRPQMGAIAAELADLAIVTDDNPRSEDGDRIAAEIVAGMPVGAARVVRDRAAAIGLAVAAAAVPDAVLIAGKGHEPYQEIAGRKLPFDDAQVAQAALRARRAA